MSKTKTHVLIPYTTEVACGSPGYYITAKYRDRVTCKRCKRSEHYKALPRWPKERRR